MLAAAAVAAVIMAMVKNNNKKLVKYHAVYVFFLASNVKSKKRFVANEKRGDSSVYS